MNEHPEPRLQAVHRALADPLRIRLFELLVLRPQSAKELAVRVGLRPDRLYHHLAQLEEGKLIEIAEYRPLAGGKVERVYAPTAVEPLVDDASPADVAPRASQRSAIEDVLRQAREQLDEDGVWTTVLWSAVDREDRGGGSEPDSDSDAEKGRRNGSEPEQLRGRRAGRLPAHPGDHLPGQDDPPAPPRAPGARRGRPAGPRLTGPVSRVISGRLRPRREPGAKRYDLRATCHNLLHHQIAGQTVSPGWPHGDRRHQSWWPLGGQSMSRARLARAGSGLGWRGLVAGSALTLAAAAAGVGGARPPQGGDGDAAGSGTAAGGGTAAGSGAGPGSGAGSGSSPGSGSGATTDASATCGKATGPFRVSGTLVLGAGQKPFISYGITVPGLQGPDWTGYTALDLQKITATASQWCANTVRLQLDQDEL